MMMNCSRFLVFFLSILYLVVAQNISTVPDTDGGPVYIIADENEVNITIMCTIFNAQMIQLQTPWHLQRLQTDSMLRRVFFLSNGVPNNPMEFNDDLFATGELITGTSDTYLTTLQFLNFTSEFDTTELQCGTNSDLRTFFLGFPVLPSVVTNTGTVTITEGSNTTVSLAVPDVTPFPPSISSQWTYTEQNLTTTSTIILSDYNITFNNILRNYTGQYTLTVTNTVGSVTGSFTLDVQFPPEATPVSSTDQIVLTNSTMTLIAFIQIIGNPVPGISWTGPDGQPRNNNGRFNTSIPGQLIISNIVTDDNGTYTCTISNGIGQNLTQSVDVIIAMSASSPQNVTASSITVTSVTVTWSPPVSVGVPEFSYYQLSFIPSLPSNSIILTTNTTSLIVNGLLPNTEYNITVIAIITSNNFDTLLGATSDEITIKTITGAPQFDTVTAIPINGTIVIKWTLIHTGGLDTTIDISCREGNGLGVIVDSIFCDTDCDLMGNTTLDPVIAGDVYRCNVIAINDNGTDSRSINDIVIIEGLPSVPIVSYDILVGLIRLTVRAVFTGTNDNSFRFVVDINHSNNGSLLRTVTLTVSNYINNQTIIQDVLISEGGLYDIVITTRNSFGTSQESEEFEELNIVPVFTSSTSTLTTTSNTGTIVTTSTVTPSTTSLSTASNTPTNTITATDSSTGGLSGGAIAGIIIAIIILIAIIAIVVFIVIYIIYQNRGDSYRVEGGKVFVEEHDIDLGTVLQDRKSVDGGIPEKTTDETTITQPKQELHYADLADFSSSRNKNTSSSTETAKPMPIEEVQYAVIRPQDLKQNGDN